MKTLQNLFALFTERIAPEVRHRVLDAIANHEPHILLGKNKWVNGGGSPCLFALATMAATGNWNARNEDFGLAHGLQMSQALGITEHELGEGVLAWDALDAQDHEKFREMIREHLLAEGYRENDELNRRICEEFRFVDAETAAMIA